MLVINATYISGSLLDYVYTLINSLLISQSRKCKKIDYFSDQETDKVVLQSILVQVKISAIRGPNTISFDNPPEGYF